MAPEKSEMTVYLLLAGSFADAGPSDFSSRGRSWRRR